jgi:hypothetical protein
LKPCTFSNPIVGKQILYQTALSHVSVLKIANMTHFLLKLKDSSSVLEIGQKRTACEDREHLYSEIVFFFKKMFLIDT